MSNWVNLHAHTTYSILDGASKISEYVARAKELGMPAAAITDHGNLYGAHAFWKECNAQGIKPIIGMEAYVAPGSRLDKTPIFWGEPDQRGVDVSARGAYTHMLLIARSAAGLRNLYKLHYYSFTEGFYYHGRVDLELLQQYSDGIIATTGCAGGAVPTLLRLGKREAAENMALKLKKIFPGRLYVEVMHHGLDFDETLNEQLARLAEDLDLPLLATGDSHYTFPHEREVQDALLSTRGDFKFTGHGYHLRSYEEMAALPLPDGALANTLVVAEQVESYDEVFAPKNRMPKSLDGLNLREVASLECHQRNLPQEYQERLEYELDIIERMGYEDYFLVLADLVNWAKSRSIMVGPARGSAGGSLLAYLLNITDVDPLRYGLLFERFLNPARISPPDIDVDLDPARRDEVVRYAVEKYGAENVANIITFGTIKSRAALKDANRVLGGEPRTGEELVAKLPPMVLGRQAPLSESPEIRDEAPDTYDLALGLEGLIRSTGKHAAGLIISPEPLYEGMPTKQGAKDDLLVTGFDMGTCEELGYIKMDLLGLDTLTIIGEALRLIENNNQR